MLMKLDSILNSDVVNEVTPSLFSIDEINKQNAVFSVMSFDDSELVLLETKLSMLLNAESSFSKLAAIPDEDYCGYAKATMAIHGIECDAEITHEGLKEKVGGVLKTIKEKAAALIEKIKMATTKFFTNYLLGFKSLDERMNKVFEDMGKNKERAYRFKTPTYNFNNAYMNTDGKNLLAFPAAWRYAMTFSDIMKGDNAGKVLSTTADGINVEAFHSALSAVLSKSEMKKDGDSFIYKYGSFEFGFELTKTGVTHIGKPGTGIGVADKTDSFDVTETALLVRDLINFVKDLTPRIGALSKDLKYYNDFKKIIDESTNTEVTNMRLSAYNAYVSAERFGAITTVKMLSSFFNRVTAWYATVEFEPEKK